MKKLIKMNSLPILIPILGFSLQLVIDAVYQVTSNPVIDFLWMFFWYVVPLLSLFGFYLSIRNLIKRQSLLNNLFGLLFNLIWFGLYFLLLLSNCFFTCKM